MDDPLDRSVDELTEEEQQRMKDQVRALSTAQLEFLEDVAKTAITQRVLTWREDVGMVITDPQALSNIISQAHNELEPGQRKLLKNWQHLFKPKSQNDCWKRAWVAVLKVAEHFRHEWLPLQS